MKTKIILFTLCLFFSLQFIFAQNESPFYYYKGEKVNLEIDYSTISFVSKSGNFGQTTANSPFHIKSQTTDYSATTVIPVTRSIYALQPNYVGEIELQNIASPAQYQSVLQDLRNNSDLIKVSPSYIIQDKKMGVSNNFYVKLRNPEDITLLNNLAQQYSIEILGYNEFMPLWFTLSCTQSTSYNAVEAANFFQESNLFESAEPEFLYHDLIDSNDPWFNYQWGLKHTGQSGWSPLIDIKAEQAWSITTGSSNIKTAVYDQGIKMDHLDLQSNIYGTGYDANTGTTQSQIRGPHGTGCAGIIGAVQNNNIGVSGVAPTSKLISVSINISNSDTPQQLANGFNWAWQNGADVISNSWGGYTPSAIIENAVTNTLTYGRYGKGTVIVFSAGNNNNTSISFPKYVDSRILLVGALSPCGERKNPTSCDGETNWGSCYGDLLDIMAPGVKIPTTTYTGGYTQTFNGTSSACPHVSGVAALVLSVNPELTVQQVGDVIERTAQKIRTDKYSYQQKTGRTNGTWNAEMGYGLIDAFEAVKLAQSYNCVNDLNITQPITVSRTYQAANLITASSHISENTIVSFKAQTIRLNPGFDVKSSTSGSFSISIDPCTVPISTRSAEENTSGYDYQSLYKELIQQNTAQNQKPNQEITIISDIIPGHYSIYLTYPTYGKVEIFDMQGSKIRQTEFSQTQEIKINLDNQPSGIYIIKVSTNETMSSTKIMLR